MRDVAVAAPLAFQLLARSVFAGVNDAAFVELSKVGIQLVGKSTYELANGSVHEYGFGLAQIEFMGEITAGRVTFGPDDMAPILGITALESVGITIDPASQPLKRLPAVPLK